MYQFSPQDIEKPFLTADQPLIRFLINILLGLNNSHVKSLQDIVKPFKTAELTKLVTAFRNNNLNSSAPIKVVHGLYWSTKGKQWGFYGNWNIFFV